MRIATGFATAAAALVLTAASAATATAAQVHDRDSAAATFTVWATNVNVRDNPSSPGTCDASPSTTNCPVVSGKLQPGQTFTAVCQKQGQTVGGNPWWVFVQRGDSRGYLASYYVDYPADQLPGVPVCGS